MVIAGQFDTPRPYFNFDSKDCETYHARLWKLFGGTYVAYAAYFKKYVEVVSGDVYPRSEVRELL